ncbi:MAG: metallophosphoesterase family protein [Candidatus Aureabacteria bacterium]|nr:metallophosphoesterase family protein [Candidatus Auribacterota bacterium]
MKTVVITDVHANLPALKAALKAISKEGYDAIFHTGDAIAIGPYPAECLDLLLNTPRIQFVMGNHETYFVNGVPEPRPAWMSAGEVEHQHWTHAQLAPGLRSVISQWPYILDHNLEGVATTFMHYAPEPFIQKPTIADLDRLFKKYDSRLIFYGHHHAYSDMQGRARYMNPGSLGCHSTAVARYCVAEYREGNFTITYHAVPYSDTELFRTFEQRKVPDRQIIYKTFFGGRFQG